MSAADWTTLPGRIVEASLIKAGDVPLECGLENCECPEHEVSPWPPGTYVTVRLSEDVPVGLGDVTLTRVSGGGAS